MHTRLTAIFDEATASLVPNSSAIYDREGTKMELAEITLIAANVIKVQLNRYCLRLFISYWSNHGNKSIKNKSKKNGNDLFFSKH